MFFLCWISDTFMLRRKVTFMIHFFSESAVIIWYYTLSASAQWNPRALQWHHNERYGVSNHQHFDCLHSRLFRCRSKKISKLRVDGDRWISLSQKVSNAEFFHLMASSCGCGKAFDKHISNFFVLLNDVWLPCYLKPNSVRRFYLTLPCWQEMDKSNSSDIGIFRANKVNTMVSVVLVPCVAMSLANIVTTVQPYSDVTSASWCPRSPATRVFVQQFVLANMK